MNLNVNGQLPPELREERTLYHTPNPISVIGEITRIVNSMIVEGEERNPLLQNSSRLLMLELGRRDGVTQLELVRMTHLKAPTISITLQKLEKHGYVVRQHDNYDMRSVRVYLTEKGKSHNQFIIKKVTKSEARAMDSLTDAEAKQLMRLLLKIKEDIAESTETNKFL